MPFESIALTHLPASWDQSYVKICAVKPIWLPMSAHTSVLLDETANALLNQPADQARVFIDATFGRGGHSRYLLNKMSPLDSLIVIDKDPEAIAVATLLSQDDPRLKVFHGSFAQIDLALERFGFTQADGIMADLGVSSPQLDVAARGFSFQSAGPIDMRMDSSRGETAGELIERLSSDELADVLYEFGEERHSRRIARAIKDAWPLSTTLELGEVIKAAHPKWEKRIHPATKSFQGLRIKVNNELGDIDALLDQSLARLKSGGVLAVISFHSLEDRIVKRFLRAHSQAMVDDPTWPEPRPNPDYHFDLPAKLIQATPEEASQNPRARSAKLRFAIRRAT